MTHPTCAGVQSPITPHLPTRLCQSCELYSYAADGIKPAARRAGPHFRCMNYVAISSCAGESQLSAGAGVVAGPADSFCSDEE